MIYALVLGQVKSKFQVKPFFYLHLFQHIPQTKKNTAETVCPCRRIGMLLIYNINPKICSRFTSIPMLAVKLDYKKNIKKSCCLSDAIFFLNLTNILILYGFCGARHGEICLTSCNTLVEFVCSNFVTN